MSKNRIFDALGKAASDIPSKLGESLGTVQRFDTPLEQAITPSLEALKACSSGVKVWSTIGSVVAIPFFKHAIDSTLISLSPTHGWAGCIPAPAA